MSFPPAVFLTALGLGFLLNLLVTLTSFSSVPFRITGALLGFAGSSLGMWGAYTLHHAGTTVRPDRPVSALVTNGPFRYSRNPLYLALTTIYLGITIYAGILWPFVTLIPALAVVNWKIVHREESYLESRFGDNYRAYKERVRRYI